MQNSLEAFEVQPGLSAEQLALVGRNHVQANHDLNEHLRRGAHAKLAQMKYMAGGGDKNRATFFQRRGFAIADLPGAEGETWTVHGFGLREAGSRPLALPQASGASSGALP